jgi:hypothetical protein
MIITRGHYAALYHPGLRNKLFDYYEVCRRFNDDIENIHLGYSDIKESLTQIDAYQTTYQVNANMLADQLDLLVSQYLADLDIRTFDLLAYVRILERNQRPWTYRLYHLVRPEYRITVEEHGEELVKLKAESAETICRSLEESEAFSRTAPPSNDLKQ